MFQAEGFAGSIEADDIKTAGRKPGLVDKQPFLGSAREVLSFFDGDRAWSAALFMAASRFYFHKDNLAGLLADNIYLAMPEAPVTRQNMVAG